MDSSGAARLCSAQVFPQLVSASFEERKKTVLRHPGSEFFPTPDHEST
jgi:hypothetical protein